MSLYALPMIGSAGLGNELFPWARAELFARRLNIPVLAPRWARIRVGPYLRREPEKRRYGRFFATAEHVHGLPRVAIGAFGRRIREGQSDADYAKAGQSSWPWIVEFEGIGELFTPLAGGHEFIRKKLWNMTRTQWRPAANPYGSPFVALHVRRGDITRQGFTERELDDVKQFTPLSWFVAMVRALRRSAAARDCPVVVFTDGSTDELGTLLALDGVRLHDKRRAITDLWTMSRAATLFASGYSTFGMWASYLGGMPTICAPGKLQQRVQAGRPHAVELEVGETDGLPDNVLTGVRSGAIHGHE